MSFDPTKPHEFRERTPIRQELPPSRNNTTCDRCGASRFNPTLHPEEELPLFGYTSSN